MPRPARSRRARAFALEYAARARAALDGEPDRASLEALTHLVVDRTAADGHRRPSTALDSIREKVEANERLDFEDGLTLMESDDLLQLGELADTARRVRGGTDEVYFVQNLYLNQTNVCRVKCKFCAFAVTQKQAGAYTITAEELVEDALRQRELTGFTEIHMVNGENPHVGFDFYVDTIRSLHEAMPDVHLKCYTASEIHHMTKLSGLTHEQVLVELKARRARLAARRRRRGLRRPRPPADRAGEGASRLLVPHAPTPRTGSASRRTARCSTGTSRPTRSASTTCCACASSRTRPAASSPSSRSRSIPRTPSSSGAAGRTPPAPTT